MKLLETIPMFAPVKMAHKNKPFSSQQLRLHCVTVFYFWSKDCTLCHQMPSFATKLEQLYGQKVQCIAVHDGEINESEVAKNTPAIMLIDASKELATLFQVRMYPSIFVFDQEQKLRFKQMGSNNTHMLLKRIEKFV